MSLGASLLLIRIKLGRDFFLRLCTTINQEANAVDVGRQLRCETRSASSAHAPASVTSRPNARAACAFGTARTSASAASQSPALLSVRITRAPALAYAKAIARPMPLAAPDEDELVFEQAIIHVLFYLEWMS